MNRPNDHNKSTADAQTSTFIKTVCWNIMSCHETIDMITWLKHMFARLAGMCLAPSVGYCVCGTIGIYVGYNDFFGTCLAPCVDDRLCGTAGTHNCHDHLAELLSSIQTSCTLYGLLPRPLGWMPLADSWSDHLPAWYTFSPISWPLPLENTCVATWYKHLTETCLHGGGTQETLHRYWP